MSIRTAVIGTGAAGHNLASDLKSIPGATLVAAVDLRLHAAEEFARIFGGRAYEDVPTMVERERPDLVIVASSNDAHADNVISAIECGVRNIFCEKPLAIRIDDATRMVEMAELHDVRTSLGFAGLQAGISRMLEMVRSGELGRVLHMHLHTFRGYGFWGRERVNQRGIRGHHAAIKSPEVSGGWTVHHACHMIYLLSQMAGPVKSVSGNLLTSAENVPSEEIVNATFQFENGTVGSVLDSIGSFRGLHCGVIGTKGTLLLHDDMKKRPGARAQITMRFEGQDEDVVEHFSHDPQAISRLRELVNAIRENRPSPIPFRAALENLLLCQSIRESSELGSPLDMAPHRAMA